MKFSLNLLTDIVTEAHYFDTTMGKKGLIINDHVFKRHYQTEAIV